MSIQHVNVKSILITESIFSLDKYLFETDCEEVCPAMSFHDLGILYPIVVYRDSRGQLHLIDGKKRIHYAKDSQLQVLNAIVFAETVPVTEIITLILCDNRNDIGKSTINKIQFICFALSLGAPESWILNTLCSLLEFKPSGDFLRECERMNNLPLELKSFCHEKKFSLKQILNLTYYPEELLIQLMKWKTVLQLTASMMDEMASHLNDYLRSNNRTLKDFLAEPEIHEILESSLSPRDKTEKLRRFIFLKRFPILSEVTARIQDVIEKLNLPKIISINWDKTLENKKLDFTIHVQDPKKWPEVLDKLNSEEVKTAIKTILEEL